MIGPGLLQMLRLQRLLHPDPSVDNANENTDTSVDRDMYVQGGPALQAYREHLKNVPQRNDYNVDFGHRLLAGLAGAFAAATGGGEAGYRTTTGLLDKPYQDAVRQYKLSGEGLQDIASLEDRSVGRKIEMDKNKVIEEDKKIDNARQQAQFEQQMKVEKEKYDLALRKAQTDEDKAAARERYENERNRLMELRISASEHRQDKEKWGSYYDPESGDVVTGPMDPHKTYLTKPNAAAQEIMDQAGVVESFGTDIKSGIKDIEDKLGPIKGRWEKLKGLIGTQDPAVRSLHTDLESFASLLPKLHGYRGGVQAHRIFSEALGNFEQNPAAMEAAINAVMQVAREAKLARTPGHKTPGGGRPGSIDDIKKKYQLDY